MVLHVNKFESPLPKDASFNLPAKDDLGHELRVSGYGKDF